MKFVRYGAVGAEKPGMVDEQGRIRDLSFMVADFDGTALDPDALARLSHLETSRLPLVEAGVRLGPPVKRVGNFIAIGLNYADHAAETGAKIPSEPIMFNKAPSSLSGPNDPVSIPPGADKVDWEVELAIIIGRAGFCIPEAEVMQHIAGYAICNDVSERAWQAERGGQWTKGKSAPTFGPLGPWMVTPDEIADVETLGMFLDLNGQRMQTGSTATMIFKPAYLVHYCSLFMRLEAGDVITTGTPPGVGLGMKPPRYLKPGERMRLGVDGLGVQEQIVVSG